MIEELQRLIREALQRNNIGRPNAYSDYFDGWRNGLEWTLEQIENLRREKAQFNDL